ncbi:MAG: hypothetical protein AAF564_02305 [Bacteroidota bacterium]
MSFSIKKWPSVTRVLLALVCVILAGCSGGVQLTSNKLDREVAIDGVETEWMGALTVVPKEDFSVGLLNDDEHLYISFITGSPKVQQQIVMQGLMIWFDREGGKGKSVGIKFPIGLFSSDINLNTAALEQSPELIESYFNESLSHFELFDSAKEPGAKYTRQELSGLEMNANLENGSFVYELKIPLTGDHAYTVSPYTGNQLGIIIEAPKLDEEEIVEQIEAADRGSATRGGGLVGNTGYYGNALLGASMGGATNFKYKTTMLLAD